MPLFKAVLTVLARALLSLVFLVSSVNQILYWKETEKRFMATVADWQTYSVSSDFLQGLFHFLFAKSPLFLMTVSALQLLGALLLLFGKYEKWGALLLICILLPATFFVQHFWFSEAHVRTIQFSFFLRDLAIVGGLLLVVLRGTRENMR
ncbi:MAG: DoxX family membrane protein [Verrucomicrobiota bacterium]|nr:DoxX family membrane protein [Verrucomicrobiota bacterium]